MNIKRFLIASIAVFVAFQAMDFIIHGVILMSTYQALQSVWRPDMMEMMWIMRVGGLVMSFLLVYIFVKGYEGKGILEGVRFGLVTGLLMQGVGSFMSYVMYPLPLMLAVWWALLGTAEFIVVGIIAAAIYRPKA